MHRLSFDFDHKKATQALNFFASKEGGRINKIKALKLVYFADRYHLRKYGRLVTNDAYFAMNYGPVPSGTKDIAEGSDFLGEAEREYAAEYIDSSTGRFDVSSVEPVDDDVFSESDVEALEFAWNTFGDLEPFDLAELTHKYPEWSRHRSALGISSRIQMSLLDFLEDSEENVEKCFGLTKSSKELRREELQEMAKVDALWS